MRSAPAGIGSPASVTTIRSVCPVSLITRESAGLMVVAVLRMVPPVVPLVSAAGGRALGGEAPLRQQGVDLVATGKARRCPRPGHRDGAGGTREAGRVGEGPSVGQGGAQIPRVGV